MLKATRPRQWVKNVLVFAAPGAAGLLSHAHVLERTAATFGLFLCASAGTYLVNDSLDAQADRHHPVKRLRPIASGELPVRVALGCAALLLCGSLAGAALLSGARLAGVIAAYLVITFSYSLGLKRVAVVELACVSAGFVLRAVAGGPAVHVPISPWFFIVTSAVALLVVAGKRSAELTSLGERGSDHRAVLREYTPTFLRSVRLMASTVAVVSYALWAFERTSHLGASHDVVDGLLFQLSVVPFVLGLLSVELAIETGKGGAPEDLILEHRPIQILGACCVLLLALGIYS